MAENIACGCGCHLPREKGERCLGTPCEYCREAHDANPVSPDIMKFIPDPEEPMTTTPVPITELIIHRRTGVPAMTITPHDADAVARLIHRANATDRTKPFVQKARGGEGTGSLGLYVEAVLHNAIGKPYTHMKFFVVGANVYAYSRTTGDTRANWRRRTTGSLHEALRLVQVALDKPTVKMFGHPVLVELTAADLSQIETGGIPEGRFRGQYRIEKDFGRYDFKMPVVSADLPARLARVLREDFVTATPETPGE